MSITDRKKIYNDAIEKWGIGPQLNQIVEECAEMIVAVNHFKRGRIGLTELTSELADITIMSEQITYAYELEYKVEKEIERKLARLQGRLEK